MKAIDLNDAEIWCDNWRQVYQQLMMQLSGQPVADENVFRGFLIPISSIQTLASMTGVKAVRAYLATQDVQNPALQLLLVPVQQGEGAPPDSPGTDIIINEETQDTNIYDFTRPCPIQCDITSPLYSLANKKHKEQE